MSAPTATETWSELVTVGLLGTDRRDPPELPDGPVADVVADAVRDTPQGRLLASVSAMVVARRCGARPLGVRPPLIGPPVDARPMIPVAAGRRWHEIVAQWPVLEPEWLGVAHAAGWKPSPDVLVAMLRRHRRSAYVAARVMAFGGPVAPWLVEHLPDMQPFESRPGVAAPEGRVLTVPAELERILDEPDTVLADALVGGLIAGEFKWAHRTVLLNTMARIPHRSLGAAVVALEIGRAAIQNGTDATGERAAPLALWESLVEVAEVRRAMLDELEPSR